MTMVVIQNMVNLQQMELILSKIFVIINHKKIRDKDYNLLILHLKNMHKENMILIINKIKLKSCHKQKRLII